MPVFVLPQLKLQDIAMLKIFSSILIVLFTGAGCVLTTPTDPYAEIPRPDDRKTQRELEKKYKDRSLPPSLTLEKAVNFAIDNNPGLAAIKRDISAAKARKEGAVSRLWPGIRAGSGYTRHVNEQPLTSIAGDVKEQMFTDELSVAEVNVQMPLFTSGRTSNQIKAAMLGVKASVHSFVRTRNELVFNVSRIFFDILAQRRVVESALFSQKALKEHLKHVELRIENQKATKVERLRTEVRLANVREELARARNVLAVKRYTLAKLLGISSNSKMPEIEGTLHFENTAFQSLDNILSKVYENREDYLAARKHVEAQAKQVDTARAERWPSLTLEGAYGNRRDAFSTEDAENFGKIGLMVSMPLFEGGRLKAEIKEEKATLAAAQERLKEFEQQIRLEVQTARSNISTARERVNATRKAVKQGKESLRVERNKYRAGEAAVTNVLDAQADLLQSQTSYYRALTDYNSALAELDLAMGIDSSNLINS